MPTHVASVPRVRRLHRLATALATTASLTLVATAADAGLLVPPSVVSGGHQNDALVKAGFLDVTLYGADPSGKKDSTAAIQAAIDDARDYLLTTYLPPGTYLISDTLSGTEDGSGNGGSFCYQVQSNTGSAKGGEEVAARAPSLVGPPSGPRARLKLADASAGFGDPTNPKPAIHFVDLGPPSQFVNPTVGAFDCLMYAVLRDVDVDLGSGNSGAVGVQFYSAQFSYMANVTVSAGSAYAGIQGAPATSDWVNLTVDGGQYGIVMDNAGTSSLVGITLTNQTVAGFSASANGAVSVAGFRIVEPSGAAVVLSPFNGVRQLAGVSLVDGSIEQQTAAHPAIANPAGVNLLVQNVYVKTPASLVACGTQTAIAGSGGNDLIAEYAYTDTSVTGASYAPNTSYDLIDGVVGQKGLTRTHLGAGAPPSDLVLRHLPGTLPWITDPGVVDVTSMGADPTGYSDSTSAIQKAIDASAGHGDEVFLPRGNYLVSGTLTLHPDTRLFGAPGPKSTLWATTWDPKGKYVPFIQTANTATGKTFVGDIQILLPNDDKDSLGYAQSYLGALDWQAGRSSVLYHATIILEPDWGTSAPSTAARKLIHVEQNGGGKFYGITEGGAWSNGRDQSPDFRFLFVDGTSAPLTIYGPNLEHAESDDFVEIANAKNVRIFESKTECRSTWAAITSSKNVLLSGLGGDWAPSLTNVGVLVSDSSNVELAILGWYADETLPGASYVSNVGGGFPDGGVSWANAVSLFQEGSFDDSPFPHCGDGVCDGAETSASCPTDCASPGDAGATTDAEGGGSDAGGAAVDATASAGGSAPGASSAQPASSGGCACAAGAPADVGDLRMALVVALGAVARRRRRRVFDKEES